MHSTRGHYTPSHISYIPPIGMHCYITSLVIVVYAGDEVDVLSGVAGSESGNTESAFLAREHVSNLFERYVYIICVNS